MDMSEYPNSRYRDLSSDNVRRHYLAYALNAIKDDCKTMRSCKLRKTLLGLASSVNNSIVQPGHAEGRLFMYNINSTGPTTFP